MVKDNIKKKDNTIIFPVIIFLIPLIFIYDILIFLLTKSSCSSCGSISEYMKTLSISGVIFGDLINKANYIFKPKRI